MSEREHGRSQFWLRMCSDLSTGSKTGCASAFVYACFVFHVCCACLLLMGARGPLYGLKCLFVFMNSHTCASTCVSAWDLHTCMLVCECVCVCVRERTADPNPPALERFFTRLWNDLLHVLSHIQTCNSNWQMACPVHINTTTKTAQNVLCSTLILCHIWCIIYIHRMCVCVCASLLSF